MKYVIIIFISFWCGFLFAALLVANEIVGGYDEKRNKRKD